MSRAVARLAYTARTALRGLRASPVPTAVAVATIAVALLLVGAFALLARNMEDLLDRFGDELHVAAFLEADLPRAEQEALAELVASVEGVERVTLVTADEALRRFEAGVGRGAAFLEGLDENPLPASLEIALAPESRSSQGLAVVEEALHGLPGIEDLQSGRDWVEGYLRAVALVKGIAAGLGAILGVGALVIVANTIRLALFARRDELEILSLVGASRAFVNTPFLLEGAVQGALGAGAALLLLYALFRVVLPELEFGLELALGGAHPRFFTAAEAATLVLGGAALGGAGSAAALSGGWRA